MQGGNKIEIKIHSKKDDRENAGEKQYTNLFINNLPDGYNNEQLRAVFQTYGTIASCEINPKNNHTGFVSFSSHAEASAAIEGLHMKQKVGDSVMIVAPHVYKKENELKGAGGSS